MREELVTLTPEVASRFVSIVRDFSEFTKDKKLKIASKDLLLKLRGVKTKEQLLLSRTEYDLYCMVSKSWPGGSLSEGFQLGLFSTGGNFNDIRGFRAP